MSNAQEGKPLSRIVHCQSCTCHDSGEAFAPRHVTSSPGIRRAALEQTAAEVRRAKDSRKKPGQATP